MKMFLAVTGTIFSLLLIGVGSAGYFDEGVVTAPIDTLIILSFLLVISVFNITEDDHCDCCSSKLVGR